MQSDTIELRTLSIVWTKSISRFSAVCSDMTLSSSVVLCRSLSIPFFRNITLSTFRLQTKIMNMQTPCRMFKTSAKYLKYYKVTAMIQLKDNFNLTLCHFSFEQFYLPGRFVNTIVIHQTSNDFQTPDQSKPNEKLQVLTKPVI